MSRAFTDSDVNYLIASSAALTATQEEFTLFAWIKYEEMTLASGYFAGVGQLGAGANRLMIGINRADDAAIYASTNETSFNEVGTAASLTQSVWGTVAIRRRSDGAGGYLKEIIAGGVVDKSVASAVGAGWRTGSSDLILGRNVSGGTPARGKIEHVAMWAAAKSDAEMVDLASGTPPDDATISSTGRYAYYKLDTASLVNEWAADSQALTVDSSPVVDLVVTGTVAFDGADLAPISAPVVTPGIGQITAQFEGTPISVSDWQIIVRLVSDQSIIYDQAGISSDASGNIAPFATTSGSVGDAVRIEGYSVADGYSFVIKQNLVDNA